MIGVCAQDFHWVLGTSTFERYAWQSESFRYGVLLVGWLLSSEECQGAHSEGGMVIIFAAGLRYTILLGGCFAGISAIQQ